MTIERKTIGATIKQAGEDGSFEAVIATFGAVDSDGDIVEPGAFGGATVSVLPAHDSSSVPLGKARVEERGKQAVAVGRFNLDIKAAAEWSSALKFDLDNAPSVQEWSWGFNVPKDGARMETIEGETIRVLSKVDLREVSPVLRGASIGTGTLSAKAEGDDDPPPLVERIKLVTGDVEGLVARILDVAEKRKENGRHLGPDVCKVTVAMAEECAKMLDAVSAAIKAEMVPDDEATRAAARFLASEAQRAGMRP